MAKGSVQARARRSDDPCPCGSGLKFAAVPRLESDRTVAGSAVERAPDVRVHHAYAPVGTAEEDERPTDASSPSLRR